MKVLLFLLFASNIFAAPLNLPSDISQVASVDGPYEAKYSNATRNRIAIKNFLGGEGYQSIVIEKYAPGRYGATDTVIQAKTFDVPSLPKVKEYIEQVGKKSQEATYGCCNVSNIKWANSGWSFLVEHREKKFKCTVTDIDSKELKTACSE